MATGDMECKVTVDLDAMYKGAGLNPKELFLLALSLGLDIESIPELIAAWKSGMAAREAGENPLHGAVHGIGSTYTGRTTGETAGEILGLPTGAILGGLAGRLAGGVPGAVGGTVLGGALGHLGGPALGRAIGGTVGANRAVNKYSSEKAPLLYLLAKAAFVKAARGPMPAAAAPAKLTGAIGGRFEDALSKSKSVLKKKLDDPIEEATKLMEKARASDASRKEYLKSLVAEEREQEMRANLEKQSLLFGAGVPELVGGAMGGVNAPSGSALEGVLRGGLGAGLGADVGAIGGAGIGGLGGAGLGGLLGLLGHHPDPKQLAMLGALLGAGGGGLTGGLGGGVMGYRKGMERLNEEPPVSKSHQIIEHRRSKESADKTAMGMEGPQGPPAGAGPAGAGGPPPGAEPGPTPGSGSGGPEGLLKLLMAAMESGDPKIQELLGALISALKSHASGGPGVPGGAGGLGGKQPMEQPGQGHDAPAAGASALGLEGKMGSEDPFVAGMLMGLREKVAVLSAEPKATGAEGWDYAGVPASSFQQAWEQVLKSPGFVPRQFEGALDESVVPQSEVVHHQSDTRPLEQVLGWLRESA